jgi:hypothetical protein
MVHELDETLDAKLSAEDDDGCSLHALISLRFDLFERAAIRASGKIAHAYRLSREAAICLFFKASLPNDVALDRSPQSKKSAYAKQPAADRLNVRKRAGWAGDAADARAAAWTLLRKSFGNRAPTRCVGDRHCPEFPAGFGHGNDPQENTAPTRGLAQPCQTSAICPAGAS